ncbi:hypothetical protein Tco_1300572 [Tanacetum coccineum]
MARQSKRFSGEVTPLFESMLVQNQVPEGESSVTPTEPQPTPSTSQPNVSEPQTEILQTKTPPTISHEPQTKANIEKILPSLSIYQRKHIKVAVPGAKKPCRVLLLRLGGYTPGSDEGRLKLEELMAMCTKLSKRVHDLEKEKDDQAVEILKLKKRVKKLERQRKSSISHLRRRIYSDFDGLDDDMENVEGEIVYATTSEVSTAGALVSTARPTVSTDGPSTSADGTSIGILEDEMVTMADTLITIRQTRTRPSYLPRPTSVVITDTEQEQRRLTTPPPSQPSDTRDKGKGIMVEPDPPVKIKRSDQGDLQLQADAELAQLMHQEELTQVERRQRERAAQEEAFIAALYEEYDTIQASIDADALFAARLQQEERVEMLEKMLNWKLEAEAESTMAFELLKFIKSPLED